MTTPLYKILLLGAPASGKTSLVKRICSGTFECTYVPTLGVTITPVFFNTPAGSAVLHIWEFGGEDTFGLISENLFHGASGAIILHDYCNRGNSLRPTELLTTVQQLCKDIPVVMCHSKDDTKVNEEKMWVIVPDEVKSFWLSAKDNYHCTLPFLHLAT